MKTINEFCLHILRSGTLEDKLLDPPKDLIDQTDSSLLVPLLPSRQGAIGFSEARDKMPKLKQIIQSHQRAIALHHFANHELMAIEIFAYALLKFQNLESQYRWALLNTLRDEQKHFKLYQTRIEQLGLGFGERPLNSVFWKFVPLMNTAPKFSAIMSISLEGANLDHALVYQHAFTQIEDMQSAQIMETVYKDEIKHVIRGKKLLQKSLDGLPQTPDNKPASFWEYYNSLLEYPFSPRRAKGSFYIPHTRQACGFDDEFIQKLGEFKDQFSNRKLDNVPEELKKWGLFTG